MTWDATTMHEADNVAMLLRPVRAGDTISVNVGTARIEIGVLEDIALCHKIALADLAPGAAVVKYGQCIGEAIAPVRRGAWVHIHNLRSRRARGTT